MILKSPPLYLTYIIFGLGVLLAVWILQYGFGFQPCPLCYYQRYPWWLMIFLGLLSALSNYIYKRQNSHYGFMLILGIFVMIFSMMLAGYHAGIEWKLWQGPAHCTAVEMIDPLTKTIDDFFSAANVTNCDKPALIFAGLSLSGWNFIASLVVMVYLLFLLFAKHR
ncbi:MAG: disulfide bond formation protein B [Alphaproteobacteria bacterium]